jgi:hypothetical protein
MQECCFGWKITTPDVHHEGPEMVQKDWWSARAREDDIVLG